MKAIGFIGDSGAGKTTLIERLIGHFSRSGLRLAAIKHAHHGFDIDRPGKDSHRFRCAGAAQVLLASDQRWALLVEEPQTEEPPTGAPQASALERQLARLGPCDLVLVEGFRGQAGIPFIEVRRQGERAATARATGPGLAAIATDSPGARTIDAGEVPVLDLDDIEAIALFITRLLELAPC